MEGQGSSESSDPAQLLKRITILENKLKSEKRQKKEEQLKMENVVYQISKQYNKILDNMVDIYLDQGRRRSPETAKVELEGLKNVSRILKSLKETIELLEDDYERIGKVLMDLLTVGGIVRRMKFKKAPSISTTTACEPARANVETPTSTTTVRNDGQETRRFFIDPSDQKTEICSEDISIADQRQQFLECQCRDDDGNVIAVGRKSHGQPKQATPGASTAVPVAPSPPPPSPVASTSVQAGQFSVDTNSSGDGERRQGRLRVTSRMTYTEQLEGCPARHSESGPQEQQPLSNPIRRRPVQRKRRPNVKKGPPGQKKKRRRRMHVCPQSECGKRFSLRSDFEHHHCPHECFTCGEVFGDRVSLLQHRKDEHGESVVAELEPVNRKGSSVAQARSIPGPGAVGGEMLCTNGVTISTSRKRPRKQSRPTSRTSQVGLSLNHASSGHGGKGTAPDLAAGSWPRVKIEQD